MSTKTTGNTAAQNASETLTSDDTGDKSKSAAGSTLSQKDSSKETSDEAATAAAKTLQDGRTSDESKSAAGSALAQKE